MNAKKYEIRRELGPDDETWLESAYNLSGDYIGDVDTAQFLCDKKGISPETLPGATICSIGFCEAEQKWYGWSHRAIFGFGIGDSVKKGDVAFNGSTPDDLIEDYVSFFGDDILHPDAEKREAKRAELRKQCRPLPNGRGIIVDDLGFVADAVVLGSTDNVRDALAMLEAVDHIAPAPTQLIEPHEKVILCGRGEWTAETLADARQMACDFAESVS